MFNLFKNSALEIRTKVFVPHRLMADRYDGWWLAADICLLLLSLSLFSLTWLRCPARAVMIAIQQLHLEPGFMLQYIILFNIYYLTATLYWKGPAT